MNQAELERGVLTALRDGDPTLGMTNTQVHEVIRKLLPGIVWPLLVALQMRGLVEGRWEGENFPGMNGPPPDAMPSRLAKRYWRLTAKGRGELSRR